MTTLHLASERDDPIVRAFLRDNPMTGWVDITIEREPSFFAGADWLGREWAVLCQEDGELVGMYTAALRALHVNGRAEAMGYLGGLRVDRRHRHRIRYLREGFDSVRRLAPARGTLDWWVTVIGDANNAARRVLEAGLRGMPTYIRQGDYLTLVLPTGRGRGHGLWRGARAGEEPAIAGFHNRHAAPYQCSPVLEAGHVARIGLDRFLVHERGGKMLGAVALWDQRAFKQVVVQRYGPAIGMLRPAYNALAGVLGRLPLPAAGQALDQTFLAFLALDEQALPQAAALIEDALHRCRTPAAVIGLHAGHALLDVLGRFRPVPYPAGIYAVTFGEPVRLDGRPVQPEAALL